MESERILIADRLQAQLEADMDAVCVICEDGDVTHSNQILFCESCNIAVHQACYRVSSVPADDYFCRACVHFGRDKAERAHERMTDLPINCELCPRVGGAFEMIASEAGDKSWVHVVCAKWQGCDYVNPEDDENHLIEDVQALKDHFRNRVRCKCTICGSARGEACSEASP